MTRNSRDFYQNYNSKRNVREKQNKKQSPSTLDFEPYKPGVSPVYFFLQNVTVGKDLELCVLFSL